MVCFVALDFVLRVVPTRVVDITLIVSVARMHPNDTTTDPTRFGIPGHVITDFEWLCHRKVALLEGEGVERLPQLKL